MYRSFKDRFWAVLMAYPAVLARLGIVDREKGTEAFDLAVPTMATGFFRTFLRTSTFFLVSFALGDTAVAALELGFQYYFLAFALLIGLATGTISVVARFVGAGQDADADFAVKQSLYLALAISAPIAVFTWTFAEPMIDLLTDDPETILLGGIYLRIVMLALPFRFFAMVALRALQGAADMRTPMYIRFLSIPLNIGLTAVLIFGAGPFPSLGIAGAAWGRLIAGVFASLLAFAVLTSGRYPIHLRLRSGRHWDWEITRELLRVSYPVTARQFARTLGRFPFLFVLASLGTNVVAAYAIGRRIIRLAMTPGGGFGMAASTLVGQRLGAGEESEAEAYGWQTLRIALATQLLIAVGLVAFARPIVDLFGTGSAALATEFVYVFGFTIAGLSVARTMRGGLQGAGDTVWPLYGTIVGTTLRVSIALLALPSATVVLSVGGVALAPGLGLGMVAVYAAIVADMYSRGGVILFRYWSGAWKAVARRSAVGAGGD